MHNIISLISCIVIVMKVLLLVIVSLYVLHSQGQHLQPRVIGFPIDNDYEKNTVAFIDINNEIICSGAIIHSKWIITSATCTKKIATFQLRFQLAHELSLKDYINGFTINHAITHPNFNEVSLANDIGLVETVDSIDRTSIPLRIPLIDSNFENSELILRGAGKTLGKNGLELEDAVSAVEQDVYIPSNKWCQTYVPMTSTKMCSYLPFACKGDQGASLITTDRRQVIGVVSISDFNARFCGPFTPVPVVTYTKLFSYRAWIRRTTGITHL